MLGKEEPKAHGNAAWMPRTLSRSMGEKPR